MSAPEASGLVSQPVRDVGVVIVAAGAGSRVGGAELKQFRWVGGKPMLLHSLQRFHARPDVAMVVCVLPRSHAGDPPPWLFQSDLDRLLVCAGGRERGDSVYNGLEDLPEECAVALVHDAARPFVDNAMIDRVIHAARAGTGAVPCLPIVDTLKQTEDGVTVVRTVPRDGLWRAQTPQGFPRSMIEDAYVRARRDGVSASDDAALAAGQDERQWSRPVPSRESRREVGQVKTELGDHRAAGDQ